MSKLDAATAWRSMSDPDPTSFSPDRASDLERIANSLARRVASARERHVQNRGLWIIGATGLVVGVLLALFLPRVLPFSADTHTAALIIGIPSLIAAVRA